MSDVIIYQNDQYYLKIRPIFNGDVVDDTCDEMVIKFGTVVKKKSLGEITYDSENTCWLFPLTIDQSSSSSGNQRLQAWFSFGDNYYSTPIVKIKINKSYLEESEVI